MEEYIVLIALAYFKKANGNYTINELTSLLGYTHKRIEKLMYYLISQEYIEYINDLLYISKKGLTLLIANDMGDYLFDVENINMIHITPENAVSITEPYVPKDFTDKYDG